MGSQRLLLLAIVVSFAGINYALAHTQASMSTMSVPQLNSISTVKMFSKRLLRSHEAADLDAAAGGTNVDSEERVYIPGLSKVNELVQKVLKPSSSTNNPVVKTWLKSKVHPQELFRDLRLQRGIAKADDPTLLDWLRLAAAYRAKNGEQSFPDMEICYLLLKSNKPDDLTRLFRVLKQTPGLEKLATSMETSLSGGWINKALEKGMHPDTVYKTLRLKSTGPLTMTKTDELLFLQWLDFVNMYRVKNGFDRFSDFDMLRLFHNSMPEENVVMFLHSLRRVPDMKKRADAMQELLFVYSKTSHEVMDKVWLKAKVHPEDVFDILRLKKRDAFDDKSALIHWLKYTQLYNDKISPFSGEQIVGFMTNARRQTSWELAGLFQSIKKNPDLKSLADNVQTHIFQEWVGMGLDPIRVGKELTSYTRYPISELPKSDPIYGTLEAFILYFAENKGGEHLLKKVRVFFANGDPSGALTAAMKSQ